MTDEYHVEDHFIEPPDELNEQPPPTIEERLFIIEANQQYIMEVQNKIFAQTTWCAQQLQMAMEAFKSMPGLGNMLGRRGA